MHKKKRFLIKLLVIIGVIVLLFGIAKRVMFPKFEPLPVTGNHTVLSEMYTWVDENRVETYENTGANREVTVKIWYPEEEGNYPLVVFSHGAGGILESNASTCMELASNGYVAVAIAHPYQAAFVKNVDGKVTIVNSEFMKQVMTDNGSDDPEHDKAYFELAKEWMKVRIGDENFVLDTILKKVQSGEGTPFDRVDSSKIGLFGHSLGGATSVAVGRERDDITAVIDIEGTMLEERTGYANGVYTYREEPYPIPILDINSRMVYEKASALEQQYVNFYVGEHAPWFQEVVFEDAGHMNFCDLALASPILAKALGTGDVDARTCLENLNEIVLNYFNYYLKNEGVLDIKDSY